MRKSLFIAALLLAVLAGIVWACQPSETAEQAYSREEVDALLERSQRVSREANESLDRAIEALKPPE